MSTENGREIEYFIRGKTSMDITTSKRGQAKFVLVVMALIVAGILIFLFPLINDMVFFGMNSSGITHPEGYFVGSFIPYFWILVAVGVVVVALRGGGDNASQ